MQYRALDFKLMIFILLKTLKALAFSLISIKYALTLLSMIKERNLFS